MEKSVRNPLTEKPEARRLLFCIALAFIFGLLAHAAYIFNFSFSHDSITQSFGMAGNIRHKIGIGRFLEPVYWRAVRGVVTVPWLISVLAFTNIGVSVYLCLRMLNIRETWAAVLISGIFVTSVTVTALAASFMEDLDVDTLALLLSVTAAYGWAQNKKGAFAVMAVCVFFALGLYQAYLSVTVTLIVLFSILRLLRGDETGDVLRRGLIGAAAVAAGGALYFLALMAVTSLTGVPLETGKSYSLSNALSLFQGNFILQLFGRSKQAVKTCLHYLGTRRSAYMPKSYLVINAGLGLTGIAVFFLLLRENRKNIRNCALAVLLAVLLPFFMNIAGFLNGGSHELMGYAYNLCYPLLAMLLCRLPQEKARPGRVLRLISCVLMALLVWCNIQAANAVYTRKNVEHESTLSLMTRVVERMEEFPGYDPGETPVLLYGIAEVTAPNEAFTADYEIIGATEYHLSVTYLETYYNYLMNILQYPIKVPEEPMRYLGDERITAMPVFPREGSLQMLDGILVVHLGDSI